MFTGLIQLYDKTGRAVKVNSSNKVVLSENVQGATTFQLVGCRAWDAFPGEIHPRCVSLMDASRTDWYVRHSFNYLRVNPQYDARNPALFDLDSSFILHSDTFYPDLYALESVNFPDHYVKSHADGRLGIVQRTNTTNITNYYDTASFRIYEYHKTSEYLCLVSLRHNTNLERKLKANSCGKLQQWNFTMC